jgi:hypothetical protein
VSHISILGCGVSRTCGFFNLEGWGGGLSEAVSVTVPLYTVPTREEIVGNVPRREVSFFSDGRTMNIPTLFPSTIVWCKG